MPALQRWFNLQLAHETCKICHYKHLVGPFCGNKTSTTQGMMCFVPRKQRREREVGVNIMVYQTKGKIQEKRQQSCLNDRRTEKCRAAISSLNKRWRQKQNNGRVRLLLLSFCPKPISTYLWQREKRLISFLQRGHEVKHLWWTVIKEDITLFTSGTNSATLMFWWGEAISVREKLRAVKLGLSLSVKWECVREEINTSG